MQLRCADCSFQHSSWEFCIIFSTCVTLRSCQKTEIILVTCRSMLMGTLHLHRPDVALGTKYLRFLSCLATLADAGLKLALFTPQPAIHHPHQFHQLGRVDGEEGVCMDRKHFFITFLSNS